MPFPEVPRVIYNKNPLDQVICQLRFAPILKIDAELPAEFQDQVRSAFPTYSETADFKFQLAPDLEGQVPVELMNQVIQSSGNKNYLFVSEDNSWKINLTRTFIALTSNAYIRWEDFKERLEIPISAFIGVYEPGSITRVGLRYINVIHRTVLGMPDQPWRDLIQPQISGILAVDGIGESVKAFNNGYEIGLSEEDGVVRIRTAFVQAKDDGEIGYKIDNDFFISGRTAFDSVSEKLDYLNSRSGYLFRWCITDLLHEAMEPNPA